MTGCRFAEFEALVGALERFRDRVSRGAGWFESEAADDSLEGAERLAASGRAEACVVCNDCVENPRTDFSYCRGNDEGAEHCGLDIWGSCWTYGSFCGCIVVY